MEIYERTVLALMKAPILEEDMRKLTIYADACNAETVLQMHKTKGSLNDAISAELINVGDAIDINDKMREIGQLFLSRCRCIDAKPRRI